MKIGLEQQDIESIANKVIEKLIPIIHVQQPSKTPVVDNQVDKRETRPKREVKPRMLSVRESAGYIGIAEKTLRNRIGLHAENPFPVKPKHIGGKVLFDVKDLDGYLDALPTT
jgi:hypothetical protein